MVAGSGEARGAGRGSWAVAKCGLIDQVDVSPWGRGAKLCAGAGGGFQCSFRAILSGLGVKMAIFRAWEALLF